MWITPYQDDDSEDDMAYMFTNDLQRLEEVEEEIDSDDDPMQDTQVANIQIRQSLASLINKQDSDEEDRMVQTCAEKKHIWAQNDKNNSQTTDSNDDQIDKYNELK